jgi:PPOX class probable F420-dependent enzyme
MSAAERERFLDEPGRTAVLATTRADGRPHATPIWFHRDGADIVFTTWHESVKARTLTRDARAMLSVDDATFPFAFVVIEGRCELHDDLALLRRWSTPIAARYVPAERAAEFGARNGVPGELLVRLRPDKVIARRGIAD